MRVDLTEDEVDLLMRLCSGCDDMDDEGDTKSKKVAMRLERYFRRILARERQTTTSRMSTRQLDGRTTWVARSKLERMTCDIPRAILRDERDTELVLDVITPHGPYAIVLRGAGDLVGTWTSGTRRGNCSARVFEVGEGDLFLFGEWREGDELYDWWADLTPIEDDAP
jgi:hypothetical protein